ncbi:tetratricopeptide repeat protein [Leptolyngbya sp. GB1-A1]|uniref:tetratricopeptide repeat protein n=1 Tax=Leptolyngbya sp. GB1-A1 TaxID=2933908 RepID=UPI0032978CDF
MSIDDDLRQVPSVTEGDRALKLFTDRIEFVRLFTQALNDEPPGKQILFFYGDGGNGKSLLLKFLRQQCCKWLLPQTWEQVKRRSDADLANYIENLNVTECIAVPAVLHDFGQSGGIERPQDPFYGLLMLRRNLAEAASKLEYRLRFPLYDFACIWYLHQKGKSSEEIKSLFPLSDAAGLVSALVDAVTGNPFGSIANAVLGFLVEDLEEKVTVYSARIGLSADRIKAIQHKDVDTELIYELPKLLADDLNAAIQQKDAPKRLVLMFDTHEAFWGRQKDLADTLFFERDEWLRRLLRSLNLQDGIVVVVAGREPPRWVEARSAKPRTEIPQPYLTAKQVGHFAAADAALYLQRVGITDELLCQAIIATASMQPNEVHPLFLGLSADTVLQAKSQGITLTAADFPALPDLSNQAKALIERLLKYVDQEIRYAVHALSACRSFDFDLYLMLGEALKFRPTRPGFDLLTSFSFVWQSEKAGQHLYRIHDLLRRLNDEEAEATTQAAHQILLQHYQQQSQPAEEIYHLNRLNWEQGIQKWGQVFDDALRYSRYEQCRALLEIRNVLFIRSDFYLGYISTLEGQYFANLSKHQEALQEYRESIEAYNEALHRAPDDINTLNNKGNTLQSLGNLQAQLSQYEAALSSYQESIEAYNEALHHAPDDINALNNKGNTLQSLGNLQAQLSQYEAALSSYQESIEAYNEALHHAPDDINALNNKGSTLQRLGNLKVQLSQYEAALSNYQESIEAYNKALHRAPDDIYALNNKGLALQRLGNLKVQLSQHEAALSSYQESIEAYNEALHRAPDYIYALNNKGLALQRLGNLQAQLSQYEAALSSYQESIEAYNEALHRAPDDIQILNNKGLALQSLGNLQAQLSQHEAALSNYQESIEAYNEALHRAPDDIQILNNKGLALQSLGNLQAQLSQHEAALSNYQESIEAYNEALHRAPDDIQILNNKGLALQSLGNLQARLSQYEAALSSYQESIEAYNEALHHAPDDIQILNNKGLALQSLGNLQARLSQYEAALSNYQESIEAYNEALHRAPDDINALNNKGLALQSLGNLQAQLSQYEEAQNCWQTALRLVSRSLELAPNDRNMVWLRDQLRQTLAELRNV